MLRWMSVIALLGLAFAPAGSPAPSVFSLHPSAVPAGKAAPNFRNWVSYYGTVGATGDATMQSLGRFDFIDIDAESGAANFADATGAMAWWHARGNVVVSYLNVGACETFRSYWQQCLKYKEKKYQGWPQEYWMNITDPGYQDLIVNTVAPQLAATGVDGFYLDNLDVYQETFKGITTAQIKQGVANIMRRLRQNYPNLFIVAQNGVYSPRDNVLFYIDNTTDATYVYHYADAEAHEDVNSFPTKQRQVAYAMLTQLKQDGLSIMLLDYPSSTSAAQTDFQRTVCAGFLPYDGNRNLDKIYWRDTATPRAPTGLAGQVSGGQVQITWNAVPSCAKPWGDDYGVTSYILYRDGAPVTQTYLTNPQQALLSFVDAGVQSGATYTYTVAGVDTGLHVSPPSAPVVVTLP